MASESTDEETLRVSLPAELDRWLDDRADALGVERETVLEQLLASYRTMADRDEDWDGEGGRPLSVADTVTVEETVEDRVGEATTTVQRQVGERIDALETEYRENLADVRERVVQLKRDLDGKASADHDHDAFRRIDDLADSLAALEDRLDTLDSRLDETIDDQDETITALHETVDDVETDLEELQDRLETVAWVVSDLREAQEKSTGLDAVERIKRAAAQMDVDRAKCENCGEGVEIALMTDPECPHCQATVTDIQAAEGFFGKPRLLVASQLESGETR